MLFFYILFMKSVIFLIDDEALSCSSSESMSEDESYSPPNEKAASTSGSKKTRTASKRTTKQKTTAPKVIKKKGKNKGARDVIRLDIAKSKVEPTIPEYEVHVGNNWHVKVSLYEANQKYYICLRNCKGEQAGYGANLPLDMLDELVKGFNMAKEHVKQYQ
jgi:hypothetical protein